MTTTPDDPRESETLADAPPGAASDMVGSAIGPYRLLQLIGEGGFGAVYMAEQREPIKRKVALKLIKLGMDTRQVIARFEAERQALAMMDHPNIARVLDAGASAAGRPYFVMELVKGVPITQYCDTENLSTDQRLDLFIQVCHAVQHAHQKGIIHRDLKPGNVLVTLHDGRPVPKVIDFGIAKATHAELTDKTVFTEFRQFIGTPEYMSPEQAEMSGLDIDTRSDIYALGVLLYELLTGTTPFDRRRLRAAAVDEIQRIIREEEPPKPSTRLSTIMSGSMREPSGAGGGAASPVAGTPGSSIHDIARHRRSDPDRLVRELRGDLDWIVMKAMEKDRTRRYETAAGLADDVVRHMTNQPVLAGPPTTGYRFRKFARRHRGAMLAASVIAGVFLLGLVGTTTGMILAMAASRRATEAQEQSKLAMIEAQEQAALSQAVIEFLNDDLLGAAEPSGAAGTGRGVLLRDVLDKAAARMEQAAAVGGRFADKPLVEATLRHTIARAYLGLGELEPAGRHAEQAHRVREATLGPDHENTLKALNTIGAVAMARSDHGAAEAAFSRGLERARKSLGADHPTTLGLMNNLAACYEARNRHEDAEPLFREALALSEKALGPLHNITLSSLGGLANLTLSMSRYEEAYELAQRVLEGYRRAFGPDHPNTLLALHNLGNAAGGLGRLEEAEAFYQDALERKTRVLGPSHPDTITTMLTLAIQARRQGRHAEAEARLREVIDVSEKALGPEHSYTLTARINIVLLLVQQNRLDDAEPLAEDTLSALRRSRGELNGGTALIRTTLLRIYQARGRHDEARRLAFDYANMLKHAGASPDASAETLNNAAWDLLTMEPPEARDPVAALEFARRSNNLTDHRNPAYLDTLARAWFLTGNVRMAVETQQRALSLVPEGADIRDEIEQHLREFEAQLPGGAGGQSDGAG
ncbi:MAG: tetratricopeptide repeat protein [Phycisphaeraceae bacterium]|nr:tetratricopeptide repeat protein [Phycisphaerales bacterium]QOJ17216.1 MAG: tetratricopeptide repeat protein [Phycisphaeraceae bacterium]